MSIESLKSRGRGLVPTNGGPLTDEQIPLAVEDVLRATQFVDIHTHLYPPAFGKLGLWGIDELLTYHYLEAEFFRSSDTIPEQYWSLSKREQADAIWRTLFVENTPISEATRGGHCCAPGLPIANRSSGFGRSKGLLQGANYRAAH
jgi:hypothetical protein